MRGHCGGWQHEGVEVCWEGGDLEAAAPANKERTFGSQG